MRVGDSTGASKPQTELLDTARDAGLRYVSDRTPGITRTRAGRGFTYRSPNGAPIKDPHQLRRIKSLAIPPAWTDVWICPFANGHIQATGHDEKGRKQYRYHDKWREVRDENKFERMVAFGKALPAIRTRVDEDLAQPGLPRVKVLATVVRLLETTFIRVGNEEYARQNNSFGLTTLRNRHVKVEGSKIQFRFRGKSGIQHSISLSNRRLASVVARCQELPGQDLFQYVDENGERQRIDSSDVNEYLQEISRQEFTAKDFRTWAGTVLAALALQEFSSFESEAEAKRNVVEAVKSVAERLGNTPAICRKCYIHPAIIDSYLEGITLDVLKKRTESELRESLHELEPEEAAVLVLLQHRLTKEQESKTPERRQPKGRRKASTRPKKS